MSRWKASGIHLGLSFIVAALAFCLLFFLWYPGVLFNATGGDRLFYLLASIDVVVGPLLTLIVYKHGKKRLKLDLAIIGLLQLAALIYGLNVMLQARPVFIVFEVDRFIAVGANDLEAEDLANASAPFNRKSWTGPMLVAALLPTSSEEKQSLMFSSATGGKDVHLLPKYYRPYGETAVAAIARAKPLAKLRDKSEKAARVIDAFLTNHVDGTEMGYVPIMSRSNSFCAIISLETGELVDILNIDPW